MGPGCCIVGPWLKSHWARTSTDLIVLLTGVVFCHNFFSFGSPTLHNTAVERGYKPGLRSHNTLEVWSVLRHFEKSAVGADLIVLLIGAVVCQNCFLSLCSTGPTRTVLLIGVVVCQCCSFSVCSTGPTRMVLLIGPLLFQNLEKHRMTDGPHRAGDRKLGHRVGKSEGRAGWAENHFLNS